MNIKYSKQEWKGFFFVFFFFNMLAQKVIILGIIHKLQQEDLSLCCHHARYIAG